MSADTKSHAKGDGKTTSKSASQKLKRRARTLALQLVYAFDQKRCQDDDHLRMTDGVEDSADAREFADALFQGFLTEQPAVDKVVDSCLNNWNLARLAVPDRSILRLGCYELLYRSDTPPKVAINEYIELAKQYGSDGKTAKLVNGVLDRIAREHRGDEVRANAARS